MHGKPFFIFSTLITIFISLIFPCSVSSTFTITNFCPFTIWPGTLSGAGTPPLSTTGFKLDSGESVRIETAAGWSGRIWARTGCNFDQNGMGKCLTGDCGGKLECHGSGATPPASLFEITFGQGDGKDFYDVSLVDGYNLPLVAWPTGATGCNATGCVSDINMGCPKELQVISGEGAEQQGVVACKSACEVFGLDQYCCSGHFANPTTCKPSYYSSVFKRACPRAYSYAFDDGTSTFTCKAYNYAIVFCPRSSVGPKKPPNRGTSSTPPSTTFSPPTDGYGSQPSGGYGSPPTGGYGSVPSGGYGSPPSGVFDSPPSFSDGSPPGGGSSTEPSFFNKSPPLRKHSYEASEGDASSSVTVLPHPALILLTFGLLMMR
ncbi:pathogenesis-related thaumatin-like protein 3.5 [Silene latifolia]|uniref:pathogenesis-related thaumatin-like protein 3.5 n=1 Tax=Silene latifolia TaxID=37657 RepID=UPI003D7781C0